VPLFRSPAEHAANPPTTWTVNRTGRRWQLRTAAGGVLDAFDRKVDAETARTRGAVADLYAKETRWYAGENMHGWKPYTPAPAADPIAAYAAALDAVKLPASLSWNIEIRPRRKSLGATFEPGGLVVFTVPPACTPDRFAAFVGARRAAILKGARAATDRAATDPAKELVNGEGFKLLGISHKLQLVDDSDTGRRCPCQCNRLTTAHPGVPIVAEPGHPGWSGGRSYQLTLRRDAVSAATIIEWYREQGQAWIDRYTPDMVNRLGVKPGLRISVRPHTPRSPRTWGTYRRGTHSIGIHWAVFQCDRDLVEYLLAHEVAHAATPRDGHGPAWKNMLGRLVFDWEEKRRKLADAGKSIWWGHTAPLTPAPAGEPDTTPFVSSWGGAL
jgi:hypothetical protein